MSWVVSHRRVLCRYEDVKYESLLLLLSNNFICREEKDSRIWKV